MLTGPNDEVIRRRVKNALISDPRSLVADRGGAEGERAASLIDALQAKKKPTA